MRCRGTLEGGGGGGGGGGGVGGGGGGGGGEGAGLAVNITGASKAHKKEKLKRNGKEQGCKGPLKQLNRDRIAPSEHR